MLYGESNILCEKPDEVIRIIEYFLINTELSSKEIGKMTGYDDTSIIKINKGELRKNPSLHYPLRPELTHDFKKERALQIIKDLQESTLTQKEIAKKYGVGRTAITAINRGQNPHMNGIDYPIRKK